MVCGVCNEDIGVCLCPDADAKLYALAYDPDALLMFKWCRHCDRYYTRCRCAVPAFFVISRGKEISIPAKGVASA